MNEWIEGKVDERDDHIEIRYNENPDPVVFVANLNGKITAQFINDKHHSQKERESVIKELEFYFCELENEDPWAYAIYHCGSTANVYSDVHWSYYPKGYIRRTVD